jgi:membrane associated rhomboid family serine protease
MLPQCASAAKPEDGDVLDSRPIVFPIRDDNPHYLTPWATWTIIGLNALAWIFVQGLGREPGLSASICQLGLIPAELLGHVPAGTRFALAPGSICTIGDASPWYTLVSSMFLHGGWLHILGNMWFLWIFGNNVEDSMGHARFVVFYLLCGLCAAGAQMAANPASAVPMVGASGAIGGVMGAYVLLYPRVKVHMLIFLGFFVTTIAVPAFLMLGYWFVIQLISGVGTLGAQGGGVAFWAHAGGFIAGALLVLVFRDRRLVERHPYYGWRRRSRSRSWRRIGR